MIRVSQSSLDSPIFRFCWRKEAGSRSLESEDDISLKNKLSQRIMVQLSSRIAENVPLIKGYPPEATSPC